VPAHTIKRRKFPDKPYLWNIYTVESKEFSARVILLGSAFGDTFVAACDALAATDGAFAAYYDPRGKPRWMGMDLVPVGE